MNRGTLALIIQEGTRLISEVLRNKAILFSPGESKEENNEEVAVLEETAPPITTEPTQEKATDIATGCVPCSIGHLGTCSGLLNEAMRFARKDGIQSGEVIERVNMCLDELNTMERVDLRPEMIYELPAWEKSLAEQALNLSRSLRHDLEGLSDVSTLEEISAKTQTTRMGIGKAWYQERLSRMTPEQRQQVEDELTKRAAQKNEEQQHV